MIFDYTILQYVPALFAAISFLLLIIALLVGLRAGAAPYTLIKLGLFLIFVGPALGAIFHLLDPTLAFQMIRRTAEAEIEQAGGKVWYVTEVLSILVNIFFGLVLFLVADAFQHPARRLGKLWCYVATICEAAHKFAEHKTDEAYAATYIPDVADDAQELSAAAN